MKHCCSVRNMPGIRAAALGNILPASGYWGDDVFTVKEHPPLNPDEDRPDALTRWADPGYFGALGIPFLSARSYKVIVSHRLVQQYFPGGDNPILKHLRVPTHAHDGAPDDIDYEIVGVVDDTVYQAGKEPKAVMYFPLFEGVTSNNIQILAVRTTSDLLQFSLPVQRQIAALDPELPVCDVLTMDQVMGESLGNQKLSAMRSLTTFRHTRVSRSRTSLRTISAFTCISLPPTPHGSSKSRFGSPRSNETSSPAVSLLRFRISKKTYALYPSVQQRPKTVKWKYFDPSRRIAPKSVVTVQ
jgi:hypothetical protein